MSYANSLINKDKVIICDTNVWYNSDLIKQVKSKFPQYKLCATYLNVLELCLSMKIKSNYTVVYETLKTMEFEADYCILIHPLSLVLTENSNYKYLDKLNENVLDVKKLADKIMAGEDLMCSYIDPIINKRRDSLVISTNHFNDVLNMDKISVKPFFKENNQNYWNNDHEDLNNHVLKLIETLTRAHIEYLTGSQPNISISISNTIFFRVFVAFYKKLLVEPNRKLFINDWVDIFNLIYLKHSTHYLTNETKWKTLISEKHPEILIQL